MIYDRKMIIRSLTIALVLLVIDIALVVSGKMNEWYAGTITAFAIIATIVSMIRWACNYDIKNPKENVFGVGARRPLPHSVDDDPIANALVFKTYFWLGTIFLLRIIDGFARQSDGSFG